MSAEEIVEAIAKNSTILGEEIQMGIMEKALYSLISLVQNLVLYASFFGCMIAGMVYFK